MRLSNNTLAILSNFSTVNSNILVRPGNTLRTISVSRDIVASARISENFDNQFAIYDLPEFLKGVKLYDSPELEFSENSDYVLIKNGSYTIKYFLTDPELVLAPEDRNIRLPTEDVSFELKAEHFDKLMRATSIFGLSDFSVLSINGEITLQVRNKSNPTSNQVSIVVGETDKNFEFNFDKNNLLMIEGSYDVTISKEMISRFTNQDFELTYFVGLSSDSFFED